jgi:hypothetical protein
MSNADKTPAAEAAGTGSRESVSGDAVNRREFLGGAAVAGASLALSGDAAAVAESDEAFPTTHIDNTAPGSSMNGAQALFKALTDGRNMPRIFRASNIF